MDPAESSSSGSSAATVSPVRLPWLRKARIWAVVWLIWFVALCILSSMSNVGPRIDVIGIDKVYHAGYFGLGGTALLLALALRAKSARAALEAPMWRRLTLTVILTGAAVGWLDEWHQTFTPGRSGLDVYDWLADIAGSLAAVPLARLVLHGFAARAERACRAPQGTP